jgi:hypothetical protein
MKASNLGRLRLESAPRLVYQDANGHMVDVPNSTPAVVEKVHTFTMIEGNAVVVYELAIRSFANGSWLVIVDKICSVLAVASDTRGVSRR